MIQLDNMTIAVGYPERMLDPEVINLFYDDYTIFIKDFFKNLQVGWLTDGAFVLLKLWMLPCTV